MTTMILALWLFGADPDAVIIKMMEPTTTLSGEPMTSQNGVLYDCKAVVSTGSGHSYETVFLAPLPAGGFVHDIDLSAYEGLVNISARCRRAMGNELSELGPPSNVVIKKLGVEPPDKAVLWDPEPNQP